MKDVQVLGWLPLLLYEKSAGSTELHYSMKKWEHSLSIVTSFFRLTSHSLKCRANKAVLLSYYSKRF